MNAIQKLRLQTTLTQQELATMSGTSQSTIAAYETGAKSPTLRTLGNLARSQNLEMVVTYVPCMTREDRRSLAFHRAIVDHLRMAPDAVLQQARKNLERLTRLHSGVGELFKRWRNWLDLPLEALITKILDPDLEARDMRQVSPFSGILSPKERSQILRQFQKDYSP